MLSMGPGGEGRVGCPEVAMRMSASHGDSREQTRRHVSARGRAGGDRGGHGKVRGGGRRVSTGTYIGDRG